MLFLGGANDLPFEVCHMRLVAALGEALPLLWHIARGLF